jgi:uncharacterized protein (DUF58 family)
MQQFLDPATLAAISNLELAAKTVVDGFVTGLHRSPDFGFSQEFAEYSAYTPGDDMRLVDWNVYARTERMYLKRFRGETNCYITLLLDASASMGYASHAVKKMDYARFLASSIAYMANQQRDAAGLIVFHEDVANYIRPSTRPGQFHRLVHGIEDAKASSQTDFTKPLTHFQQLLHRRGIVIVISDFWNDAGRIVQVVEPLRLRGNEVILFHVLDPEEIQPRLEGPVLLRDMETQDTLEVSPAFAEHEYRRKIEAHIETLRSKSRAAGIDYCLLRTDQPLNAALREYLTVRRGRK